MHPMHKMRLKVWISFSIFYFVSPNGFLYLLLIPLYFRVLFYHVTITEVAF